MLWIIKNNIAISCLPKNASSSIRQFARDQTYPNKEVLHIPVRVGFIREPLNKLISVFSFFKYQNEEANHGGHIIPIDATRTWESCIDYVLDHDDPHWNPQVKALTYNGQYVPTVTHRLEDINKVWGNYYKGLIPWVNATAHYDVDETYRINDIHDKYAADFDKWLGL